MSYVIPKNKVYAESAYGELVSVSPEMMAQITSKYGLTDEIFSVSVGGTATVNDGMFEASSGVSSAGLTTISTNDQVTVKAGQGLTGKLSTVFDTPQANNTQFCGLLTSENFLGFGYNGTSFGIVRASGGALEIQKLTLTAGATGAETATVTVNGVAYSVPLTAGTVQHNAYEIAESLNSQVNGYNFSSNDDTVIALGLLPILGGGAYAYSSATSAGSWALVEANVLPSENWVEQSNWNGEAITFDPAKGNEYKIQYPFLGFGNTRFYIKNPNTGEFVLVHQDKYLNKYITPSVKTPVFRCGWLSSNTGNTTDVIVRGAGASIENEGIYKVSGRSGGACNTQSLTTTGLYNVLSIRNRIEFNSKPNRSIVIPKDLSLATESKKITAFYIYRNATVADHLEYQFVDETNSLIEKATNLTQVTGGEVLGCITTTTEAALNLNSYINKLRPQEEVSIVADLGSGAASDVSASISWLEDQ